MIRLGAAGAITVVCLGVLAPAAGSKAMPAATGARSDCLTSPDAATRVWRPTSCVSTRYESSDVPKPIPDMGSVTSVINVPGGGKIMDVHVDQLSITHPRISDLRVSLTSPTGVTVVLVDRVCTASPTAANFSNIALADWASQPIGSTCPPNANTAYRPSNPLEAFSFEEGAGTWTLTVSDVELLNTGSLQSWELVFTYCPLNCISGRFQAGDVPKAIPDLGSVSSVIQVPPGETHLSGVHLEQLTITHPRIGDLRVSLTSPEGTTVVLIDQVCKLLPAANFSNITLDDAAPQQIGSVCPPAPGGTYRPSNPLSAFKGEHPSGSWTLTVTDLQPSSAGTLEGWGLFIASCSTGIETTSFSATRTKRGAVVRWRTGSEFDIVGFNVYREQAGKQLRRNRALIRARGANGQRYVFRDRLLYPGPVRYWLEVVHLDGSRTRHGPIRLR